MNRLEKPTTNYTVIPNEIFSLTDISAEARFCYIYFLSRPQRWKVRMLNVQRRLACGRDRAYRIMTELKDHGLLSYQADKEGGGVYTLHEITVSLKAVSGKADSGFSADILNTERAASTDKDKKHMSDSDESDVCEFEKPFQEVWESRPKRKNETKQKAFKAYKARRRAGVSHEDLLAGVQRYARYVQLMRIGQKYIMHQSTFLNPDGNWEMEWEVTKQDQIETVPKQDNKLETWAIEHGFRKGNQGESYDEYRAYLTSAVTLKKDKAA